MIRISQSSQRAWGPTRSGSKARGVCLGLQVWVGCLVGEAQKVLLQLCLWWQGCAFPHLKKFAQYWFSASKPSFLGDRFPSFSGRYRNLGTAGWACWRLRSLYGDSSCGSGTCHAGRLSRASVMVISALQPQKDLPARQGPLPLCHLGGSRGPRLPLPSPIVWPPPTWTPHLCLGGGKRW